MKKIVCFIIVIASLFAIMAFPTSAAYYPYPQNWGFDIDSSIYGSYGYIKDLVLRVKSSNSSNAKTVGYATTTIFFTSQREKPSANRVVNVALFYTMVTPTSFYENSMLYKPYSDLLTVSTRLPNSNQSSISSSPKQDPEEQEYTVGLEAGYGNDGLAFGLSATTRISASNLTIRNKSKTPYKLHCIEYDYKSLLFSNNDYLFCETDQRSVYCYETDGKCFTLPVSVEVVFGRDFGIMLGNYWSNSANWNIGIN